MTTPSAPPERGYIAGISALFGAIYFVQSVGDPASGLIAQPVRSLLNADGEGAAQISVAHGRARAAVVAKPLLALLSDFVPLFGSRRRSYLIVSTAVAAIGLARSRMSRRSSPASAWPLVAVAALADARHCVRDVLADALMIEVGKPRRLTRRLQSVQWFAAYFALLLSGAVGGWLTPSGPHEIAFLLCALLCTGSLVLTLFFVHGRVHARTPSCARPPPRCAGVRRAGP